MRYLLLFGGAAAASATLYFYYKSGETDREDPTLSFSELPKDWSVATVTVPKTPKSYSKQEEVESKHILISKQIQEVTTENLKKCTSDFGEDVTRLVQQLYNRRRMVDCEKVPTDFFTEMWEETWSGSEVSRDPKGEQIMNELIQKLRESNKKFIDPHFPPDDSSLFADPSKAYTNAKVQQTARKDQDPFLAGITGIEWKRPSEIGDPRHKPVVFSGSISPDDIAQGRLGNCYFLAAISSCANGEDDILVQDLIIEQGADVGVYGVKFYVFGKWITVLVDDLFPCREVITGLLSSAWQPIFANPKVNPEDPKAQKELWALIFEKAWAKLHLSYEATASGWTQDAHNYLTGGINSTISVYSSSALADIPFKLLRARTRVEGTLVFLSTSMRPCFYEKSTEVRVQKGLVTGHAYSVLAAAETAGGLRLVKIRNPWGHVEWNGDYSDRSPKWTPELRKEVGSRTAEDGTFWMSWDDFSTYFYSIEVCDPRMLCKLYSDGFARVDGVSSVWVKGVSAGGLKDAPTFGSNPQFELVVDGSEVWITAFQPDIRYLEKVKNVAWRRVYVYLVEGSKPLQSAELILQLEMRQSSKKIDVKPNIKYRLVVAASRPGEEGAFAVTACGHECTLRPINPGPSPNRA